MKRTDLTKKEREEVYDPAVADAKAKFKVPAGAHPQQAAWLKQKQAQHIAQVEVQITNARVQTTRWDALEAARKLAVVAYLKGGGSF